VSPDAVLASTYALAAGFATVFGLLVGSFLNVCIARMPEDRSVVSPGSACPSCGHAIRPRDNVPVLSWLLLRGRCRDCGAGISGLYPAIELLTGLLAWLLFRRVVPDPAALDLPHLVGFGGLLIFVAMLVAGAYIDLRHSIIPDELSIYAVPLGVGLNLLLGLLGHPSAPTWQQSVVGALAGAGALLLPMGVYYLLRRQEGMGFGDVKLLAMMGAFLGPLPAVPFILFGAALLGSAVGVPLALVRGRGLQLSLPFGPFLAVAALVWLLRGPELLQRSFPGLAFLIG
jgi:leader peptidase (prepilin peptidase) / N-methyltransferase